ncbi:MAG: SIS domain-containing protein [Sciscionella sp.]
MNTSFLEDIQTQPQVLRDATADLRQQASPLPDLSPARRIVLTGSGDSYIAAVAVAPLFEHRLEIAVKALPGLDASGYHGWRPGDVLVAASVSGEVRRSVEAAERAHANHGVTIAITSDQRSTLARGCDYRLITPPPLDRSIPHARDYTTALLALAALLERLLGRALPELDAWPEAVEETLASAFQVLQDLPPVAGRTWFLGAGPDRATARYGALKFWEAAGLEAWWDDLEEFAHGSLLMARPGDRAVLVSSGPGSDRAGEMMPGLLKMGMFPITVGPEPIAHDAVHLVAPALGDATWQPFTSCLPLQVMTFVEARLRGLDVSVLLHGQAHAAAYEQVHVAWVKQDVPLQGHSEVVA